jgi:hypothetical protein
MKKREIWNGGGDDEDVERDDDPFQSLFSFFYFYFYFQKPIISFLINKKIEKSEKARWEKNLF